MWKVTRYNPGAKQVTMVDSSGNVATIAIPPENTTRDLQRTYLKQQMALPDLALGTSSTTPTLWSLVKLLVRAILSKIRGL